MLEKFNKKVSIKVWHLAVLNFVNFPLIILLIFHVVLLKAHLISEEEEAQSASLEVFENVSFIDFENKRGDAYMGIEVRDVTQQEALAANLDRVEGAIVIRVIPDSPAEISEVQSLDIIISFNGRKVRNAKQLRNDILGSAVDKEIKMCVVREDYRTTVKVVLSTWPDGYQLPSASNDLTCPWFGATVTVVDKDSKEWLELEDAGKEGGVVIVTVFKGGPAELAGFLSKDVITSFNSRKVTSLRQFYTDLCSMEVKDTARVCILRGDIRKTLYIVLGERPDSSFETHDLI